MNNLFSPNLFSNPSSSYFRNDNIDDRGLLLPFLVGAAVAFPIGYIASNTNKNQYYNQPYPYMNYPNYYNQPYQYIPYYPY